MNRHTIDPKYLLRDKIRNFSIIAHVDHGKSTLADWLISSAHIISEQAGRRYLDSREDEKKRGITIKSASISFVLNEHTFNLIDSPGHVDFGANVTTALRAVDGALLVMDAVEGIMPQTRAVLKQAIKEHVVPILVINKLDRLLTELDAGKDAVEKRLKELVQQVNEYIYSLQPHASFIPFNFKTGNVVLAAGLYGWAINLAYSNCKLGYVLDCYERKDVETLRKNLNLADVISSTLIMHCPAPATAQKYKLERIASHIDQTYLQPLIQCNPVAKVSGIVTGISYSKQRGKLVSIRIFSGTIRKGSVLYTANKNVPMTVSRLCLYLGKNIAEYDHLPAGMIVVVTGLSDVVVGSTISEDVNFPAFLEIKHSAEPVMAVSFTPLLQSDLAQLKEILLQECAEDITLKYEFDQVSKQHILKGLGKLHIEIVLNRIIDEYKIKLKVKDPSVIYLETITHRSSPAEAITSNRLNKFKMCVATMPDSVRKIIDETPGLLKVPNFHKLFVDTEIADVAKKIVAIEGCNLLINTTKSVQFMQETLPNVIMGFRSAMQNGPQLKCVVEYTIVYLTDASWHVDFVHRSPQDIAPPVTKLIHAQMKEARLAVLEPYISMEIGIPLDCINDVSGLIKLHNGIMQNIEYSTDSVTLHAHVPVKNSFELPTLLMRAAAGVLNLRYAPAGYNFMSQKDVANTIQAK